MINKKMIYAIDLIFIVGTLLVGGYFVTYSQPLVIAPLDGLETTEGAVLFSFERGEAILIDDNPEFTSPEEIFMEDKLVINLEPGTYYWKVKGVLESEVRRLTINSKIDLRLEETEDEYNLVNAGNMILDVQVFNGTELKQEFVLNPGEDQEASGTKFIGGVGNE